MGKISREKYEEMIEDVFGRVATRGNARLIVDGMLAKCGIEVEPKPPDIKWKLRPREHRLFPFVVASIKTIYDANGDVAKQEKDTVAIVADEKVGKLVAQAMDMVALLAEILTCFEIRGLDTDTVPDLSDRIEAILKEAGADLETSDEAGGD